MVISSETPAHLYLQDLRQSLLAKKLIPDEFIFPDGEKYKTLSLVEKIITTMIKNHHGRDTTILALGGGVVGDIAGFVAAIYQRGLRLIHLPTTLLAQVDSSVGGKTAVNHPLGKNMIGAFHQPDYVLIDIAVLRTLPIKEIRSGIAEIIKYAVILDAVFFSWLENNVETVLSLETHAIEYCVARCCELKAKIVSMDEKDKNIRMLLNFGHTYGHAIESYLSYEGWSHGEAVAAGMALACYTAVRLGLCHPDQVKRIISLIQRFGLPITGPDDMREKDYILWMMRDKKNLRKELNLILPVSIGHAKFIPNVPQEQVKAAIQDCQSAGLSVR